MTTKVITIGQLQKGDIILSTTSDPVSKIVKFATSSKYSHARLYIGEEHIIEAIDPIVKRSKLIDVLKGDLYAAVYRMPNLTEVQKNNIVVYAKKQLNKSYDLSGAIGSSGVAISVAGVIPTVSNLIDPESDFYCSELVAFSYKSAGVKLEKFSSQAVMVNKNRTPNLVFLSHIRSVTNTH